MTNSEKEFTEMMFRWLQAKRDFPGLDVGPMPEPKLEMSYWMVDPIRRSCIREFERST